MRLDELRMTIHSVLSELGLQCSENLYTPEKMGMILEVVPGSNFYSFTVYTGRNGLLDLNEFSELPIRERVKFDPAPLALLAAEASGDAEYNKLSYISVNDDFDEKFRLLRFAVTALMASC